MMNMKKILLSILLIVFGTGVMAQGVFSLGPKIGYSSNTLTNNLDSVQSSIKNSFQIGAFIRLGKKVYFQPEANYQVVTSTLNKSTGSSVLSQDITIESLKIPALIGVKLIKKEAFNLRIMAGPAYTFLLNKKLDPQHMDEVWPIQSVGDLKNSVWSVQMGAGLDVLFITLDVRYELGIDNMYNGNSDLKLKNNMFNFSVGIKLL
jgi:hypothetical protein